MSEKNDANKKEEKNKQEAKIKELETRIKYLQADFENYKKHIDKQRDISAKLACKNLIMDLLPFIDDMEAAVAKTKDKGIENLLEKLMKILKSHGLEQIKTGDAFDHYYHEAVMQTEGEEGKIIEELQKGYMLNGIVIRHSKVKVGKGKK